MNREGKSADNLERMFRLSAIKQKEDASKKADKEAIERLRLKNIAYL